MNDLVERLLRQAYRRTIWSEPNGELDVPCDHDDDGAEGYAVNPDGPEAAATIAAQEAEIARLREAAGAAFETLWYVYECSDDPLASKAAKETADELDAALTAHDQALAGEG